LGAYFLVTYKKIRFQSFVQIGLIILLILSIIQIIPDDVKIIQEASASTTWSQTNWSARINYSSLSNVDIIKSSGDLKLSIGQGLWIADTDNCRIVNTMMDGSGWTTYGTKGTGTGQFQCPMAICYDNSTGYLNIW